ncbi:hypothetical protein [uncultured Amnibacterium sp.]|uniref:hypothetical protein n=1 Tax=uncultured Amnibacterium sp. TaxID=1631851 RepID=UPI0035CB2784
MGAHAGSDNRDRSKRRTDGNGTSIKIAPETYSRRNVRRLRISDLRGDFVGEVPEVHGVGVVLEFDDRSVELGLDRSRAGARSVYQERTLAALLPSMLQDLESPTR